MLITEGHSFLANAPEHEGIAKTHMRLTWTSDAYTLAVEYFFPKHNNRCMPVERGHNNMNT